MRLLIVLVLAMVLISCVPSPVVQLPPEASSGVDVFLNENRTPLAGSRLLVYPENGRIENPFYGRDRDGSIIEQRYVTVNTSLFEDENVTEFVFTEFDGNEHLITKSSLRWCEESIGGRDLDCGEKRYSWSGKIDDWGDVLITYYDDALLGTISFPPSQHRTYWYSIMSVPSAESPGAYLLTKVNSSSLIDEGDDTPHWYSGWW